MSTAEICVRLYVGWLQREGTAQRDLLSTRGAQAMDGSARGFSRSEERESGASAGTVLSAGSIQRVRGFEPLRGYDWVEARATWQLAISRRAGSCEGVGGEGELLE